MLCAIVNNNVRCYNESMEFAERVEDTLDDEHKVELWGTLPLPFSAAWHVGCMQCITHTALHCIALHCIALHCIARQATRHNQDGRHLYLGKSNSSVQYDMWGRGPDVAMGGGGGIL